ncbi:MAG: hypothetical protein LEGION0403_FIIPPAGN_01913 [Legionella sp.]|uniref:diguanylate cyclase domain-containing protein n=1 Tax=Legionella sp. TaxID=459 RepID=UPI003D12B76E
MRQITVLIFMLIAYLAHANSTQRIPMLANNKIQVQLLLETSRRLQLCFREKDFIARLGGDEFTAIVPHAPNKQTPQVIAERIIEEFQPIVILENGEPYSYSISIGSAIYPDNATTATELVVKADLAMYDAKKVYGCSYSSLDGLESNQSLLQSNC